MGTNQGAKGEDLKCQTRSQPSMLGLNTVFKAVVKTRPVRLHMQSGRVRREAATASRWLLSTQLSVKKQVTFVVTKSNWVIERSRAIELLRHISLLSASQQYGGLPILATANTARKQGKISIAHSPNLQRVLVCWPFPTRLC